MNKKLIHLQDDGTYRYADTPIELTSIGVTWNNYTLTDQEAFDLWFALLDMSNTQLWIGDFLVRVEADYPKIYEQLTSEYDLSSGLLYNHYCACKQVPIEYRSPNLVYSHYFAVSLIGNKQLRLGLIQEAAEKNWPIQKLLAVKKERLDTGLSSDDPPTIKKPIINRALTGKPLTLEQKQSLRAYIADMRNYIDRLEDAIKG